MGDLENGNPRNHACGPPFSPDRSYRRHAAGYAVVCRRQRRCRPGEGTISPYRRPGYDRLLGRYRLSGRQPLRAVSIACLPIWPGIAGYTPTITGFAVTASRASSCRRNDDLDLAIPVGSLDGNGRARAASSRSRNAGNAGLGLQHVLCGGEGFCAVMPGLGRTISISGCLAIAS